MEKLPVELLDKILNRTGGLPPTWEDLLLPPSPTNCPNATLVAASLVSRQWADRAQIQLLRVVIFPVWPDDRTYAAWMKFAQTRPRRRTHSLWIAPCARIQEGADAIGYTLEDVLGTCDGLKELSLGESIPMTSAHVGLTERRRPSPSWDVFRSEGLQGTTFMRSFSGVRS